MTSEIRIDLDDPRTAKIGEVIGNKTSKRILSVLAEKEMSESELGNELGMAMNTVGYNVKKLEEAGLIEKVSGFLWSVKGKRIHKYRIANRKIVISPKSFTRGIVPTVLITGAVALGIKIFYSGVQKVQNIVSSGGVDSMLAKGAEVASANAPAFSEGGRIASDVGTQVGGSGVYNVLASAPDMWAWYLLGALSALLIFLLWNWWRK